MLCVCVCVCVQARGMWKLEKISMKGVYCINAIQGLATAQIILTTAYSGNVRPLVNGALLLAIIGHMARGGAEAHLNSPLWKESRMRGDRESSTRIGMRSEEERLQTFQNWPTDAPVSPAELARAGFHYLGYGDTVQCFCCDGILRHWVHGDTPRGEHERHFPACRWCWAGMWAMFRWARLTLWTGSSWVSCSGWPWTSRCCLARRCIQRGSRRTAGCPLITTGPQEHRCSQTRWRMRASSTQVRPRLQQG